jgi:hypothetical protein
MLATPDVTFALNTVGGASVIITFSKLFYVIICVCGRIGDFESLLLFCGNLLVVCNSEDKEEKNQSKYKISLS